MNRAVTRICGTLSFLCIVYGACSGDTGSGIDAGQIADGGADLAVGSQDLALAACTGTATFTMAQATMLSSCGGFPRCHLQAVAGGFAGNLDLTTANAYAQLVNVQADIAPAKLRVKPGDALNSFLVEKLTNTQGPTEGAAMPQHEGLPWQPPDEAKLQVLRCWIGNGAKND